MVFLKPKFINGSFPLKRYLDAQFQDTVVSVTTAFPHICEFTTHVKNNLRISCLVPNSSEAKVRPTKHAD